MPTAGPVGERTQSAARIALNDAGMLANYRSIFRNRSALAMTDTELKVIAALAIIGLNSNPNAG